MYRSVRMFFAGSNFIKPTSYSDRTRQEDIVSSGDFNVKSTGGGGVSVCPGGKAYVVRVSNAALCPSEEGANMNTNTNTNSN